MKETSVAIAWEHLHYGCQAHLLSYGHSVARRHDKLVLRGNIVHRVTEGLVTPGAISALPFIFVKALRKANGSESSESGQCDGR